MLGRGFAIPLVAGRGAGLGNEMIVWGKAYVAGQALGLKTLRPAFGLNARGYSKYFGTSKVDWIYHRALRAGLPSLVFTEAEYRKRQHLGLAGAVRDFVAPLARSPLPYVLGMEGLWGGLNLVRPARDYLRHQLLGSRRALQNLFALDQRLPAGRLNIGFHIRRGDFGAVSRDADFQGKFNVPIPLEWYVAIARRLMEIFKDRINILVVSDAPQEELAPFGTEIPCFFTDKEQDRDISDLLTLGRCDLIVCSISSYSLWAAFFSEKHYLWFAPNLTPAGDFASIWGHEKDQRTPSGETSANLTTVRTMIEGGEVPTPRGVAIDWDGQLPDALIADLEARARTARIETDLLCYGVTPLPTSRA